MVAALRPPNADASKYDDPKYGVADLNEYVTPWLAMAGHPYTEDWFEYLPERIAVRSADGLSAFATPAWPALATWSLGSARARRVRRLRARLVALGGSALPWGRGQATGRPAAASGARASRLQSRPFHCV